MLLGKGLFVGSAKYMFIIKRKVISHHRQHCDDRENSGSSKYYVKMTETALSNSTTIGQKLKLD